MKHKSVKDTNIILKSVSMIDLLDISILFTNVKIQVKFSIHWILDLHLKLGPVHLSPCLSKSKPGCYNASIHHMHINHF